MDILFLVILGLVQGLTEFLPVSSSGHLVLLSNLFGIEDSLFLSIILHVATLLSILVVLKKEVWGIIKKPFGKTGLNIMLATIPTGIIAIVLMPIIENSFSGKFLPFCFLGSAVLLMLGSFVSNKKQGHELTKKDAIIIGIAQGFATLPGLSRSGTTISAGLFSGGKREEVAKFSFLMSLPIILLSLALEIYKIVSLGEVISVNVVGVILAFIVAFIIGVISIKFMIRITQKSNFKGFSIYLILLALISIFVVK